MSDDYDVEPVPGLPERLPVGEQMLWQGAPRWQDLALRAYHVDKIAAYVAVLITIRLVLAVRGGQLLKPALASYSLYLLAALLALGVLTGLAYLAARSTVYTVTSERIVMRFGIALPLTMNIPLSRIARADLARRENGTGDIYLQPTRGNRLAWLVMWPHVRAWHINNPQAALRCIPDVADVAHLIGDALAASADSAGTARVRVRTVVAEPRDQLSQSPHLTAAE